MPVFATWTESGERLLASLAVLAAGLLLGWLLLWLARRQDRRGWILARAPALPVAVLAECDDAWIRGSVVCDQPLRCPWFGVPCVAYEYALEHKVTRTVRRNGKTHRESHWRTEESDRRAVPFWLVDGDARIEVLLPQAENDALESLGTDYEGLSWRHSARVLAPGRTVSALGVKLDDGRFGPLQEVPLLITDRERAAFLARTASGERWARLVAFALVVAGGGGAWLLWTGLAGRGLAPLDWLSALGLGLAALVPVWLLSTYNRLSRTRQQAEAAWRQIDVDLGVRDALLPQLAAVVRGYRDHERELFERLAALRTGGGTAARVAAEGGAVRVSRGLLALRERYPELAANTLFGDLHERLWALEEKLGATRSFYNDVAREWNELVESVPSGWVARLCGYAPRAYFDVER